MTYSIDIDTLRKENISLQLKIDHRDDVIEQRNVMLAAARVKIDDLAADLVAMMEASGK